MKTLGFGLAAALLCGTAWAQTSPAKPGGTYYIAPGTPSTVGRNGSVTGVVPGEAVPAPHGSMSTFGGQFGTQSPGSQGPGAQAPLGERSGSPTTPAAAATSDADRKTGAAPVPGSNSFTMREARRRIETGGFTQVTGLQKDRDGIWRGKAMRNGAAVGVFCDYQGNVGAL